MMQNYKSFNYIRLDCISNMFLYFEFTCHGLKFERYSKIMNSPPKLIKIELLGIKLQVYELIMRRESYNIS